MQLVQHMQRGAGPLRVVDGNFRRVGVRHGQSRDRIIRYVDPLGALRHKVQFDHVYHIKIDDIEYFHIFVR